METLFSSFVPLIRDLADADLAAEIAQPRRLLVESGRHGQKSLDIAYAPFDHVSRQAEIVIVGLTPGRQQMRNAISEARRVLHRGGSEAEAIEAAKVFASFSGPMRSNLVAMLDHIGVNRLLGIPSTATLWNRDAQRAHFTSALRYPVFVGGGNYSGAPSMVTTPLLRAHLSRWFGAEIAALRSAIFVPLGPKVAEALESVARERDIDQRRILAGLPHPSGANAERIAFFLGRKDKVALSTKVAPDKLTAARAVLDAKIKALA